MTSCGHEKSAYPLYAQKSDTKGLLICFVSDRLAALLYRVPVLICEVSIPQNPKKSKGILEIGNMTKAGRTVHVLSDCITGYDKKKLPEMLDYYTQKGCCVETLQEVM